jgi:hypothetical protein
MWSSLTNAGFDSFRLGSFFYDPPPLGWFTQATLPPHPQEICLFLILEEWGKPRGRGKKRGKKGRGKGKGGSNGQ